MGYPVQKRVSDFNSAVGKGHNEVRNEELDDVGISQSGTLVKRLIVRANEFVL